ncbi:MAG: GxxExxY protein [Nitrospinae bacterium]|jgi:GxxExxY protein|nr:GxxExxY protein [Nitrospinota bacterium]MDA1108833.1 GxxExxY protein [Nitrospinota bacterium]
MDENEWSNKIIGACIEVHKSLGPGLLENVYQNCLAREFSLQNIPFQKEVSKPVEYKGVLMDCDLRLDFLIDNKVVVELKAVEKILPVHKAQVLTYLKLTGCKLGLLVNFNVSALKDGVERIVLGL